MKILINILLMLAFIGLKGQVIVDENFDSSNGGWTEQSSTTASYWEWGVPTRTQISDDNGGGGSAWITGLNSAFTLDETADVYLTSQAYDLSGLTNGIISFAINYDLGSTNFGPDTFNDGVILEYSTDGMNWTELGSSNTGTNWYQQGEFFDAWIGNSSGWITASHDLPAEVLGQSSVSFRFVFISASSSGSYSNEGFAIDDFQIVSGNVGTDILTMNIAEELFSSSIDAASNTVILFVPQDTDITSLAPTFTLSNGATSDIISGTSQDFTLPVNYTITAEISSFVETWTVQVVTPVPTISLYPESGIEGTQVAIYGKGFSTSNAENNVSFGGVSATVTTAGANKLVVTVPTGASLGINEISVSSNGLNYFTEPNFTVVSSGSGGDFIDYKLDDFDLGISVTVSLETADFDADGDLDFAYDDGATLNISTIQDGGIVSTVSVSSGRSVTSTTLLLETSDVNKDGYPDIIAGGARLGWFKNNGDGTWSDENVIAGSATSESLILFDVDGDFDDDIIMSDGSEISIYKNSGSESFSLFGSLNVNSLGIPVDWDEDGDIDMVTQNNSGSSIRLLKNDGNGNYSNTALKSGLSNLDNIAIGDLDNDGNLDFIYTTVNNFTGDDAIGYILNNGDGTFANKVNISSSTGEGKSTKKLKLGDLNGDGFLDIARTTDDGFGGNVFIMYESNAVLAYSANQLDGSIDGVDVELLDINNDGDLDILQESSRSGGYFPLYVQGNTDLNITSFSFAEQTGVATINSASHTINIEVNSSADLTSLTPTIELGSDAIYVSPASGITSDFTSSATYIVSTVDLSSSTTQDWTINVSQEPEVPVSLGATVEQNSSEVSWSQAGAATGYELELSVGDTDFSSLVDGFNPLVINSGSTINTTLSSLTEGTNYYLRMRAVNSNGTYSDYSNTLNILTKPVDPILTDVALSSIGQDTISFSWAGVSGVIDNYTIEVSTSETFASLLTNYPVDTASTKFIIGKSGGTSLLSENTEYWIRLLANNASGSSNYSNEISVLTKPATPVVNSINNSLVDQTEATISWNSVFTSGGSYSIEVSSTDFAVESTLLNGYPLTITGTSAVIGSDVNTDPLQPATDYWVRIQSSNSSGESTNSNVVSLLTLPETPVAMAASDVARESFTANWGNISGAEGYVVEVSSDNFASIVFTENNSEIFSTVTGLMPGTTYKYRVKSFNSTGESPNSNEAEVTTVPPNETPTGVSIDAQSISENQVIGTVIGSFSTTDPNGGDTHTYSFISGTGDDDNVSFSIDGNQLLSNEIFNLELKETYRIRIETTDQDGASFSQNFDITILNVNDAPSDISLFTTGFSPTGYDDPKTEVGIFSTDDDDVGDTDSNIELELISGQDSFEIIKNSNGDSTLLVTSIVFTNEEDLIVPITVQATDDEGASVIRSFDITINAFVDMENPKFVESLINPTTFVIGANYDSLALKAEVTDFRIQEVKLFTKLLTEQEFTSKIIDELPDQPGVYVDSLGQDDLGIAGIEYYFEATDEAGNFAIWSTAQTSAPSKMGLEFPTDGEGAPVVESVTKYGRTVDSYQIISIPFIFDNSNQSTVGSLFEEYGSNPDNRTWRIIKYNNSTGELENLRAGSQIETGAGYFFIAQDEKQVIIENARINTADPYPLELKQGWNLIGNPYNLDIDFDAVIENNNATGIVQSLRALDTDNPETWPVSQVLRSLEGGFVFSSQDFTLNISYTDAFLSFGGRVGDGSESEAEWFLPITLEQNGDFRKGGIGMDRSASASFDRYDAPVLPKWLEYLEIAFLHEGEKFSKYNKDVLPLSDSRIWNFQVSSSSQGTSVLKWDENSSQVANLQLLDVSSGKIIDMTKQSSYSFELKSKADFRILYSTDMNETFDFQRIEMLEAYPNPFTTSFKVPLHLPSNGFEYEVSVDILDLSGRVIFSGSRDSFVGGVAEYYFEKPKELRQGLYLYRVTIDNPLVSDTYTNRIRLK